MDSSKVMVCVTQQKNCERLILKGSELIDNEEDKLFVVHVVSEKQSFLNKDNDGEALEYLFGVSKDAGADLTVLRSKNVLDAMIEFALENEVTHIVMGESPQKESNKLTLGERLEKELDYIEFKKL